MLLIAFHSVFDVLTTDIQKDKKSATRKDGTQGCKVYFKVDVKRSQIKSRMKGVMRATRLMFCNYYTDNVSLPMKNSSLCEPPQEVDDEHKSRT